MTLHSNYPLTKDRSISFSELVLKLDNVINSIKSEYVVLVGRFVALLIVVFFRRTAGKFDQWRHNTNNRAAPQVQPNRWSLLVSVVANPNRFIVSKCFQQSHSNIRMTNPVSCLFLLADFFEALHKFRNILLFLGLSLLLLGTLEQVLVVHETGQTKLVEDTRKVLGNGYTSPTTQTTYELSQGFRKQQWCSSRG